MIVRSDHRFDPLEEIILGHGRDAAAGDLSVLEDHEGRDAADSIVLRRLGILVDVELGDDHLVFHAGRQLVKNWRHPHARTAPGGPEIDEHRLARLEHIGFEAGVGDLRRTLGDLRRTHSVSWVDAGMPVMTGGWLGQTLWPARIYGGGAARSRRVTVK